MVQLSGAGPILVSMNFGMSLKMPFAFRYHHVVDNKLLVVLIIAEPLVAVAALYGVVGFVVVVVVVEIKLFLGHKIFFHRWATLSTRCSRDETRTLSF